MKRNYINPLTQEVRLFGVSLMIPTDGASGGGFATPSNPVTPGAPKKV